MRIGELAKKSGLSIDTIRFYEKKGLIDVELFSRKSNNYRDYSEDSLERLMLIQQAKRLGFTLAEIQQWIRDFESDQLTADEKQSILGQKLAQIDNQIEELQIVIEITIIHVLHHNEWSVCIADSHEMNNVVILQPGQHSAFILEHFILLLGYAALHLFH